MGRQDAGGVALWAGCKTRLPTRLPGRLLPKRAPE